jgi:hypothetical protein
MENSGRVTALNTDHPSAGARKKERFRVATRAAIGNPINDQRTVIAAAHRIMFPM